MNLKGELTNKSKKIKKNNKKQINSNKNKIKKIKSESEDIFIWDLSFPEVMALGGFDVVISNPPYIEFEKIKNPTIDSDLLKKYSSKEQKKLKRKYKNELIRYVKDHFDIKLSKTCDYYVYFFYKGLELLNSKGVLVLISSNSWLDAKFGKYLQESILKFSKTQYIIDNNSIKSFEQADINTVISLFHKKQNRGMLEESIKFITLNRPFKKITIKDLFEILINNKRSKFSKLYYFDEEIYLKIHNSLRKIIIPEKSIWKFGNGDLKENNNLFAKGSFKGTKMGKFLSAPKVYFEILHNNREVLEPISDTNKPSEKRIANIKYGLKTGKNRFFLIAKPGKSKKFFRTEYDESNGDLLLFLSDKKYEKYFESFLVQKNEPLFRIEKEYWMRKLNLSLEILKQEFGIVYKEKNTMWVPNYYLKSPKEINNLIIKPRNSKLIMLNIQESKENLKSGILEYIKWGEARGYHAGATCTKRDPWYKLEQERDDEILCMKLINDRYIFPYNKYKINYDPNIYGIKFNKNQKFYLPLLNSSLIILFIEMEGRTNLGGGALPLMVYEYRNIPIFKNNSIESLDESVKKELLKIHKNPSLLSFKSIFSDFNTENPNEISIEKVNRGRKKIDNIVFKEILNLSNQEILKLYKSILRMVKIRLQKAKSR